MGVGGQLVRNWSVAAASSRPADHLAASDTAPRQPRLTHVTGPVSQAFHWPPHILTPVTSPSSHLPPSMGRHHCTKYKLASLSCSTQFW